VQPSLEGLTDSQRAAVTCTEGPLLVLAGAGSGKTRVITRRLAWLVERGVPAGQLLAVTFTNKAAREMRGRIEALVPARELWVTTFHSFGARFLRREIEALGYGRDFTIYDESDRLAFVGGILEQMGFDPESEKPATYAAAIEDAKNRLVLPEHYPRDAGPRAEQIGRVYVRYQRALRERNCVDFEDLIFLPVRLFRERPEVLERWRRRFRYLLVDEYQDTNQGQYTLARLLSEEHRNLCVTGDPDQAIYRWRGADLRNILEFERDFPDARTVKLEENFRSTARILQAAQGVVSHNRLRKEKTLWTRNPEGARVRVLVALDEAQEAELVVGRIRDLIGRGGRRASDVAVFYRTNALSRPFERAFLQAGIPYVLVGAVGFFERKEVRDLLAYLRAVANPRDDVSLLRVLNVPARGIGARTETALREAAAGAGVPVGTLIEDAERLTDLTPKARRALAGFRALLARWRTRASGPVYDLVREIEAATKYREYLNRLGDDLTEERLENVGELEAAALEYDERSPGGGVTGFLEEIALLADVDKWDPETDKVSLLTLHNAKGLEFPVVFLAGLEEGLVPHVRSVQAGGDEELEEERRLLYVGITRAKEELTLSRAVWRYAWGAGGGRLPSRFLSEIPAEVLEESGGPADGDEAPTGELDLHLPVARELPDFSEGETVHHRFYGLGRIVSLSGRGASRRALVEFPKVGRKLLQLEYAGLTRAEET